MKILIALITTLFLTTACTTVNGNRFAIDLAPGPIDLSNIDSGLLKKCNLPVALPHRMLTQAEVEHYWTIDRESLIVCAKRHGFLGDAIKFRDAQIRALTPPGTKIVPPALKKPKK